MYIAPSAQKFTSLIHFAGGTGVSPPGDRSFTMASIASGDWGAHGPNGCFATKTSASLPHWQKQQSKDNIT